MMSDEVPATEMSDEQDEVSAPGAAIAALDRDAATLSETGEEKEASTEESASLAVDDTKLYPRVPVTNARKVYLPHT